MDKMFYLVAVTRFTGHIYTFICISYFGSILFSIILFLVMSFLCHIKLAFFFMQICSGSDLANTWVRYFFVDICLYLCLRCSCKAEIIFIWEQVYFNWRIAQKCCWKYLLLLASLTEKESCECLLLWDRLFFQTLLITWYCKTILFIFKQSYH